MPRKRYWTPADDDVLRTRRAKHRSWDDIAAALGVSRSTARERGRTIGASRPARTIPDLDTDPLTDPNREPLPAGHPVSWAILTDGTSLEGTYSPWPPLPALPCPGRAARMRPPAAGQSGQAQPDQDIAPAGATP